MSKRFFLVPLQVRYDFQISRHSHFKDMPEFIAGVMTSFAKCAPGGVDLVFKHHPMDRGRTLYYGYIRSTAERLGVPHRVHAVHDAHLPTCLKNAIGTVTINSTVGIQSLYHGAPTIVLGKALYDIDGLTCKGMPLDRFWSAHKPPDKPLFQKFRRHLIEQTQLTGSFYGGFSGQ
jgi:capsular polysaccharide export protein